jgi:hypothetical protein
MVVLCSLLKTLPLKYISCTPEPKEVKSSKEVLLIDIELRGSSSSSSSKKLSTKLSIKSPTFDALLWDERVRRRIIIIT